ncbi:HD domain-containing protein [Caloramator quimbayensis]|uniref:HD domain-containing protein n=1 Tax=Caloramator quimbayensis TaxID=1147123 RepID=A0A1T4Y7C4_9CLOT|nr:HD domain-containing phosphohydrolase [Caloramator quimbayensis]SKA97191.1 HD domain-containing protein [Caloramator quimbayensis]
MKNKKLIVFLSVLYIIAAFCLYNSYKYFKIDEQLISIVFFLILSIITESLSVGFKKIRISSGFAITVASIILFGTFWTMIIISLGMAFRIYRKNDRYIHVFNTPIYITLFNVSNMAISIYFSSMAYNSFIIHSFSSNIFIVQFLQISSFVIVFLAVNSLIMAILMFSLSNNNILHEFLNTFKFGLLNIIAMAPFGYLLAYLYRKYNIIGILILMIPVLLARYTYSLYIETKTKYIETVIALMHAIEARDEYTEGHSRNVAKIVEDIARELGYSESRVEQLIIASYLHDVGKIGIDDSILNKPGKLTAEEYNLIKSHPEVGYNIIKDIKDLGDIPHLVRYHHERYDGKGYPWGKKAQELGKDVFILQLADAVDAMSTDRVYRKALPWEDIKDELIKNSGTQFHPDIVNTFLKIKSKKS